MSVMTRPQEHKAIATLKITLVFLGLLTSFYVHACLQRLARTTNVSALDNVTMGRRRGWKIDTRRTFHAAYCPFIQNLSMAAAQDQDILSQKSFIFHGLFRHFQEFLSPTHRVFDTLALWNSVRSTGDLIHPVCQEIEASAKKPNFQCYVLKSLATVQC